MIPLSLPAWSYRAQKAPIVFPLRPESLVCFRTGIQDQRRGGLVPLKVPKAG